MTLDAPKKLDPAKVQELAKYYDGAAYAARRLSIDSETSLLLLMWTARLTFARMIAKVDDPFARGVVDTLMLEVVQRHGTKAGKAAFDAGTRMAKGKKK
jgi:hypothetical protein